MKKLFKKIIIFILILEAKMVLSRFKPKVIAVTGSVGKTTTKDAIYTALKDIFYTRKNQKSFNSEFGVPLTILGLDTGWNSPIHWLKNIFLGFFVVFKKKYPEWLVLETGVDKPNDMELTAKWLKPHIAVFTAFGTVPVHVEKFSSVDELWNEKKKLAGYVRPGGAIILNADDENVMKIKDIAKREVYTFGKTNDADVVISHSEITYDFSDSGKEIRPNGINFKIDIGNTSIPVNLPKVLGIQHMYPVAASLAVGISQKMSIVDMARSFSEHELTKGRMRILEGINNSTIIDDSYNASPVAMFAAISVLKEIKTSGKKIAILGDMLEIGAHTAREHKRVGEMVADYGFDILCGVGIRAEFITDEALRKGMPKENILYIKDSRNVADVLKGMIGEGDMILIKGSQGIRTERIVKELLADPDTANTVLVRQGKQWDKKNLKTV